MKTHLGKCCEPLSQSGEPTSAFAEKSATVFLMVIKRLHGFAAMEQLTDGD
jgi:hypothetical protein